MRGVCPICGTEWRARHRRKTPFCDPCARRISANRLNMRKFNRSCVHHWILDLHGFGYCCRCGEAGHFEPERVDKRRPSEPESEELASLTDGESGIG